jgi:hypothetical protein
VRKAPSDSQGLRGKRTISLLLTLRFSAILQLLKNKVGYSYECCEQQAKYKIALKQDTVKADGKDTAGSASHFLE